MNDETRGPPARPDLQAVALGPLIALMAESLVKGDEMGAVLLSWLETGAGQEAIHDVLPDLLDALRRAGLSR